MLLSVHLFFDRYLDRRILHMQSAQQKTHLPQTDRCIIASLIPIFHSGEDSPQGTNVAIRLYPSPVAEKNPDALLYFIQVCIPARLGRYRHESNRGKNWTLINEWKWICIIAAVPAGLKVNRFGGVANRPTRAYCTFDSADPRTDFFPQYLS